MEMHAEKSEKRATNEWHTYVHTYTQWNGNFGICFKAFCEYKMICIEATVMLMLSTAEKLTAVLAAAAVVVVVSTMATTYIYKHTEIARVAAALLNYTDQKCRNMNDLCDGMALQIILNFSYLFVQFFSHIFFLFLPKSPSITYTLYLCMVYA